MVPLSLGILVLAGVASAHPTNNQHHQHDSRALVAGKTFDRYVQIFLENQDYSKAVKDRKSPVSNPLRPA